MKCTECGASGYGLHHSAACKYLNVDVYKKIKEQEEELKNAKKIIQEIVGLCPNCRNLDDAMAIAGGAEGTSTEEGCYKCEVERLDNENKKLKNVVNKKTI